MSDASTTARPWLLPGLAALALFAAGGAILFLGLRDDEPAEVVESAAAVSSPAVASTPASVSDTPTSVEPPTSIDVATTTSVPETSVPETSVADTPPTSVPETTLPSTTVPETTLPATTVPPTPPPLPSLVPTTVPTTDPPPPRPANLRNIAPTGQFFSINDDPANSTTALAFDGDVATSWFATERQPGVRDLDSYARDCGVPVAQCATISWTNQKYGIVSDTHVYDVHIIGNQFSANEALRAGFGYSSVRVDTTDFLGNVQLHRIVQLDPLATDVVVHLDAEVAAIYFSFRDPISPDGRGAIGEIEVTVLS